MKEEMEYSKKIVKQILTDYPLARDSDIYLYIRIMKMLNPKACDLPFEEVILNLRELGLPLYSTVSRARRDIQKKNPELKGTKKKQEIRAELEQEYREYFKR